MKALERNIKVYGLVWPLQVALSGLASDLSSMVNNPQLSDVQIQVDSGDVYFAHSFMVYARCPLLTEMVKTLSCVVCVVVFNTWN